MAEEVSNTQIIFNGYIDGFPTESAMTVKASTVKLEVPEGCNDAVLVKNLYLSCDPYMRSRMSKIDDNYIPIFTPGLGFLASCYVHLFPKFIDFMLPLLREGKITYVEDIAQGLDSAPAALIGLFSGRNLGKQLVRVASE
ncbi:2-alkenal reductase (NADP(+)-dependent)-like [Salvia divinorum]|uniref:2-alkenal reductase (NADP(+)-dependent)-like n=1 Tax=Salvia divinorum TaxID=28513 RepID=A0ABD1HY62_SALDI